MGKIVCTVMLGLLLCGTALGARKRRKHLAMQSRELLGRNGAGRPPRADAQDSVGREPRRVDPYGRGLSDTVSSPHDMVQKEMGPVYGVRSDERLIQPTAGSRKESIVTSFGAMEDDLSTVLVANDYNSNTLSLMRTVRGASIGFKYRIFERAGDVSLGLPKLRALAVPELLGFVVGNLPETSAIKKFYNRFEVIRPEDVFIIKVVLLFVSARKNRDGSLAYPQPRDVPHELTLLFTRLSLTKDEETGKPFRGPSQFIDRLPKAFKSLVHNVRIKGQTLAEFLNSYYDRFVALVKQKFEGDTGYTPSMIRTSYDEKQTRDHMLAIGLRSILFDLRAAKSFYVKTDAGRAELTKVRNARGVHEKRNAHLAFSSKAARFEFERTKERRESVNNFVVRELARLSKRSPSFEKQLVKMNPWIAPVGLTVDMISDAIAREEKKLPDLEEELSGVRDELGDMSGNGASPSDLFDTFDSSDFDF